MKPLVRRWTEEDLQKLRVLMSQGAAAIVFTIALAAVLAFYSEA